MQSVVRSVCVLLLLAAMSGCGDSLRNGRQPQKLPDEVAGTWQARDNVWRIVLTPDGRVDSAQIPLGNVKIRPNKATKIEMADGSVSTYKAGDCTVFYDPDTRELRVEVIVEEVNIAFMTERIEGHTKDVFIGTVSEDGTVWKTDWLSFFDLGERFPMEPDAVGEGLVFDKIKPQ
jgi:hypothetical protein